MSIISPGGIKHIFIKSYKGFKIFKRIPGFSGCEFSYYVQNKKTLKKSVTDRLFSTSNCEKHIDKKLNPYSHLDKKLLKLKSSEKFLLNKLKQNIENQKIILKLMEMKNE